VILEISEVSIVRPSQSMSCLNCVRCFSRWLRRVLEMLLFHDQLCVGAGGCVVFLCYDRRAHPKISLSPNENSLLRYYLLWIICRRQYLTPSIRSALLYSRDLTKACGIKGIS
jgi:hypothetical protein